MQIRSTIALLGLSAVVGAYTYGCSSSNKASGEQNLGSGDGGEDGGGDDGGSCSTFGACNTNGEGGTTLKNPCDNCTVNAGCPSSSPTTITGQVFDPAGKNPVWNVQVYIPNMALPAFSKGVSCASCANLYPGAVFASAVTDTSGKFTLDKNVPSGANIPLVIQIGKWRRQFTLSNVASCTSNSAQPLAGSLLSLPSSSSQGDLPDIAISTGAADSLECLPLRMGVSPNEYVPGASSAGHIHIFTGGESGGQTQGAITSPQSPQSNNALWDGEHDLNVNDAVIFSCEGAPTAYLDQSNGSTVVNAYLNNGGRVFASHYHYYFFTDTDETPANPFVGLTPALANWENVQTSPSMGPSGSDQLGTTMSFPTDIVTTLPGGGAFPEGVALKAWLGVVDALDSSGHLDVYYARENSQVTSVNASSQAWANIDPSSTAGANTTQYFSFDTPIGSSAVEQCGRAVYSDLHVAGGAGMDVEPLSPGSSTIATPDYQGGGGINIVPDDCAKRDLTPQEKALEFMLFDLTSCLVPIGTGSTPIPQPQ